MSARTLDLELLPWPLAVCRLGADAEPPAQALAGEFFSITRTAEELSVVCLEAAAPDSSDVEKDWRCLRVAGTLAFDETGVLSSLAGPLAEAGISLFALSTWDTDYLLVKKADLEAALETLAGAGHRVLET